MQFGPNLTKFLYISGGAVMGANARYWVTSWLSQRWGEAFPFATDVVNFSGSAVLGFVLGFAAHHVEIDPHLKLALTTGFLGAYTTFSTFECESVGLMAQGHFGAGILNLVVSVLVGALAAAFGMWLGGRI